MKCTITRRPSKVDVPGVLLTEELFRSFGVWFSVLPGIQALESCGPPYHLSDLPLRLPKVADDPTARRDRNPVPR